MLYKVLQAVTFDGVAYAVGDGIELADLHVGLRLLGQVVEPTTAEALAAEKAAAEAARVVVQEAPAEAEDALDASPADRIVRGGSKRSR